MLPGMTPRKYLQNNFTATPIEHLKRSESCQLSVKKAILTLLQLWLRKDMKEQLVNILTHCLEMLTTAFVCEQKQYFKSIKQRTVTFADLILYATSSPVVGKLAACRSRNNGQLNLYMLNIRGENESRPSVFCYTVGWVCCIPWR